MIDIEPSLTAFPLISLTAGEKLLTQWEKTDSIYFLLKGAVKVTKDGYEVAVVSDKGAVFGEMAILLDSEHSASVQCIENSKFYHIEHPRKYLEDHPQVIWHITQILGLRLFNLNQYLVDVKSQFVDSRILNKTPGRIRQEMRVRPGYSCDYSQILWCQDSTRAESKVTVRPP